MFASLQVVHSMSVSKWFSHFLDNFDVNLKFNFYFEENFELQLSASLINILNIFQKKI